MKNKSFKILVISMMLMFLTSGIAYAKGAIVSKSSKEPGIKSGKNLKNWKCDDASNKYKNKNEEKKNAGQKNKKPAKPPKAQINVTSVTLNKSGLTLRVGAWERLTATVNPQNATTKKVAWVSEQPWIASVNPSGKITGLRPGTTKVYVITLDGYKKAYCTVTVKLGSPDDEDKSEISLNKTSTTLIIGSTERLKVTAEDGSTPEIDRWYSLNSDIASVDQNGLVRAKHTGSTKVYVVTEDGFTAYCTVTVVSSDSDDDSVTSLTINHTTSVIALKEGTTKKLTVTMEPDDSDVDIEWKTSDSDIVTVDRYGNIKGIDEGTATITAETSDGDYSDSVEVEVIPSDEWERVTSVKINLAKTTIPVGYTENLKYSVSPSDASDKEVKWSSSNTSVATVDIWGNVEAKRTGTTTITARSADGREEATCVVTVTNSVDEPSHGILLNKVTSTLYEGEKDYPKVFLFPDEIEITDVDWDSSDTSVATVSSSGVVTGVDTGTAVITARTSDNKTASYVVKVISR